MNRRRMVCIWNHHCEGIKRNKGSSHLVMAYIFPCFSFLPRNLLVFPSLHPNFMEHGNLVPFPTLLGKGVSIFQKEYSLHLEGWRQWEGREKSSLFLFVITAEARILVYTSSTIHFLTSFKLTKSIVSTSESL